MPGPDPRKTFTRNTPVKPRPSLTPEERKELLRKERKLKPGESEQVTASKFSKKSGAGTETQKPNMAKGGRAMLKGGGICKKGMNRKAVGKNS
tara:strand:- start:74 stop:352 length:279 start_codon:yes stop_codon:yes gene_type:complete